jgi:hypothetical protein
MGGAHEHGECPSWKGSAQSRRRQVLRMQEPPASAGVATDSCLQIRCACEKCGLPSNPELADGFLNSKQ